MWLLAVVLAALGAYLTDVVREVLDNVAPPEDVGNRLTGEGPIAVLEVTHIYDRTLGAQGYVVPVDADPRPMQQYRTRDVAAWAAATHAVDFLMTAWEVTIEGKRSSPVEVVNIVPVLDRPCEAPLRGGLVQDSNEGVTDKVVMEVEIDEPGATFARIDEADSGTLRNFFASKKITLPPGEKNVLILRAHSKGQYCRWRYRIDYIADGARGSQLLSAPGGAPFEVTGPIEGWLSDPAATYDWVVPSWAERQCWPLGGDPDNLPKVAGRIYVTVSKSGTCQAPS